MQPQERPDDSRNLIIAIALCMVIWFGFDQFVFAPQRKAALDAQRAAAAAHQADAPGPAAENGPLSRAQALATSPRIALDTPSLSGSIALVGARIDDLELKNYRETLKRDSAPVTLFTPQGAAGAYYALFGWLRPGQNLAADLPGPDSLWRLEKGQTLTPETPVVLAYDSVDGLHFRRTITVDKDYLFTVTDEAQNVGAAPQSLTPYAILRRHGLPPVNRAAAVVHQGAVGVLAGSREQRRWAALAKPNKTIDAHSTGGWLGLTDVYWLAALAPDQKTAFVAHAGVNPNVTTEKLFEASTFGEPRTIAPGQTLTLSQRLFAGAKPASVLRHYQKQAGILRFDEAIDWGNFWFLTRPFFEVVHFFYKHVGNFGIAILLLTLVVRACVFPLADSAFKSSAKMRKYQPQIQEIQEKYKEDRARQSQETMALFQREKINPVAGCLPLLAQAPIFFALYKTLSMSIEMRHAPFFGWIRDLSAPDPSSWINLFGLLPFHAPIGLPVIGGVLALGILPILYGVTMWLVQSMSPPSQDPTQRIIFQWMPVLMTVLFGGFAAGLVLYWTWSNILSIAQQQIMMTRYGVETELDKLIKRLRGRLPAAKVP